MKLFALATLFVLGTAISAQDAEVTLPDAYRMQFENEWVKVVRVHYAPYAKLPAHAHTKMASAYVYLSDSGPVIFRHIGAEYGSATRAAVKAGTFRLWRAVGETHEVENTTELASDFLRVEFKTEPKQERTLKGRYHREVVAAGENLLKVQFENAQIRVTRLVCAPGRTLDLLASDVPSLLVALTPAPPLEMGGQRWVPARHAEPLTNDGNAPLELLRFEFLTAPIRTATR